MHKILICDDDRDIVNALKLYLADPDYCFYEAYDGEQAVEIVNNEKIDLILLDIMMPKTDGIKAMSLIREKHNIPVILLTAKSEESDIVLGLNVGADDYMVIPPFSVILKTPIDSVLCLSATMTSADFCAFSITLCNGYLFQGIPHRSP